MRLVSILHRLSSYVYAFTRRDAWTRPPHLRIFAASGIWQPFTRCRARKSRRKSEPRELGRGTLGVRSRPEYCCEAGFSFFFFFPCPFFPGAVLLLPPLWANPLPPCSPPPLLLSPAVLRKNSGCVSWSDISPVLHIPVWISSSSACAI